VRLRSVRKHTHQPFFLVVYLNRVILMLDFNSNFEYIALKVENNQAYFPLRISLRAF